MTQPHNYHIVRAADRLLALYAYLSAPCMSNAQKYSIADFCLMKVLYYIMCANCSGMSVRSLGLK